MNRIFIPVLAGSVLLLTLVFSFGVPVTESAQSSPYDSVCTNDDEGGKACCVDYHKLYDQVKADWDANLDLLADQETPASELVDQAFLDYRTFDCHARYLCEAVLFSSLSQFSTLKNLESTGITHRQIRPIPGCPRPQNIRYGDSAQLFWNNIKTGAGALSGLIKPNRLNPVLSCMGQSTLNAYNECVAMLRADLSPLGGAPSSQMLTLVRSLQGAHADQQGRALEAKLHTITQGMQGMLIHADTLKQNLRSAEQRFACYLPQCN